MEGKHQSLDWQPSEPESLIQGLKCPVCWDYFVKPHTLPCGHTFCLRCLQNLARIARSSKSRTPLDRLRFRCPSCRRMTMARPILRRKAAVNYALKELMNEWFESPYSSGSVDYINLRSVGSQTEHGSTSNAVKEHKTFLNICKTQSKADDRPGQATISPEDISQTEYREVLFHKINCKSDLKKMSKTDGDLTESSSPSADEHGGVSEDSFVTSSSEEEQSEQEIQISPLFGNLRIVDDNANVDTNRPRSSRFQYTSVSGVLAILFAEIALIFQGIRNSRSRLILTIFWFLYGGLIVCISRAFLPWMTFYTVLYFVIIYAEMSPSPLFRCLQNLARIARSSKSRTPLDRLRFRCPSCRRMTMARPILRRKAAVNYALKELMNEWFESPYSSGSVDYINLRSVGSQTEHGSTSNAVKEHKTFLNICKTQSKADDRPGQATISPEDISQTEYREVLFHKINCKSDLKKMSKTDGDLTESSSPSADEHGGVSEDSFVTSSSEEEQSEQEIQISPLFGNLRIVDDNANVDTNRPRSSRFQYTSVSGVLAILFAEIALIFQGIRNSRSRLILTIFWFLYGGLIVCISRAFLPWMTFYTVLYFVIIYAEMSPSPLFRCLQNLARIARSSKSRTPLDRLRFRCASCRRMTMARPILRRKAAVNYALKELMNEWFESPYSSGSVDYINLRSVGSQTEHGSTSNAVKGNKTFLNICKTQSKADDRPGQAKISPEDISQTEYREVLFHTINCKTNLKKSKTDMDLTESSSPSADEHGGVSEDSFVTSSSEEEQSEHEIQISPLFGNLRIVDDNANVDTNRPRPSRFQDTSVSGVLAILFAEIALIFQGIRNSRSRSILTIFWFLYGGLIVCISRAFLPWMTFYTVLYFIIIYAEMSPSPLFR